MMELRLSWSDCVAVDWIIKLSCVKVEVAVRGPNSPHGLCGLKATLNLNNVPNRAKELCESRGGCPGLPVPNGP